MRNFNALSSRVRAEKFPGGREKENKYVRACEE